VFKYTTKTAKEVQLVGSFTNWKDKIAVCSFVFFPLFIYIYNTIIYIFNSFYLLLLQMVKSDGDFVTIVDLPEGEHQYKYANIVSLQIQLK
jgi:hypothetical protein